jgi:DNA-binding Lrp family transcriptional regulator
MDDINRKILRLLQENSKQGFKEVARKVGVSEATVFNRVKKLEQKGIIEKYTIKLNEEKIEEWFTVVIGVDLESGKYLKNVVETLKRIGNIQAVYDVIGDFDLLIIQKFRNKEELFDYIRRVSTLPHVSHTRSWMVMKTFLEDFSPKI